MTTSIIVAGFGGQGILFTGKLLASTAMYSGLGVTWLPSYGPEMRGGTANCTVCVSDGEVGSPVIPNPDILMVFNLPSYLKFEPEVKTGGIMVSDSSLINLNSERSEIKAYGIPATTLSYDENLSGLANMILLGKTLAVSNLFTLDQVIRTMEKTIPASRSAMIKSNTKALELGYGS